MARGEIITIDLGWPPRQLSPNARVHHMEHYRFKKAAKTTAYWVTREVMGRNEYVFGESVPVHIVAHPIAGKERPDADNLIASCKATLDGIAKAIGIDDKRFAAATVEWAEPTPHGKIVVSIGTGL